jgi:hypothetical protein
MFSCQAPQPGTFRAKHESDAPAEIGLGEELASISGQAEAPEPGFLERIKRLAEIGNANQRRSFQPSGSGLGQAPAFHR